MPLNREPKPRATGPSDDASTPLGALAPAPAIDWRSVLDRARGRSAGRGPSPITRVRMALAARTTRTPIRMQEEESECGAAALGIVLAFHGRDVPMPLLRDDTGVSRDGADAGAILEAAKKHGLETKALRRPGSHADDLEMPFIAFWEYRHFVVVERMDEQWVDINDPALGRRRLDRDSFEASYSDVALTMQPGPEFVRETIGARARTANAERLEPVRGDLVKMAILAVTLTGLAIVASFLLGAVIDSTFDGQASNALGPLIGIVVGIIAVVAVRLMGAASGRAFHDVATAQGRAFGGRFLRLPERFLTLRLPSAIALHVESGSHLAQLLTADIPAAVFALGAVVAMGAAMLATDPVVGSAGILITLTALVFARRSRHVARQRALSEGGPQGRLLAGSIRGLQIVDGLADTRTYARLFERWSDDQASALEERRTAAEANAVAAALIPPGVAIAAGVFLTVGTRSIMSSDASPGELTSIALLTTMAVFLAGRAAGVQPAIADAEATAAHVEDVLAEPEIPRVEVDHAAKGRRPAATEITTAGLWFTHSRARPPAIAPLDLEIPAGETLFVAGARGSGKSTLARLLAGTLQPSGGTVSIGGILAADFIRQWGPGRIALAGSDATLVAGTIRDNLSMWDPGVADARMVEAVHEARIEGSLSRRDGLETPIAAGGTNLSSGERQRLLLARALVHDPAVLILDEATSLLDRATENAIMRRMRSRWSTVVVVPHRLDRIRSGDLVVVLEDGVIVQRGERGDLLGQPGAFRRLHEAEAADA